MNYNLDYDISALTILFFFFLTYNKKKKVALRQNRAFQCFIGTAILGTIFDIVDGLVAMNMSHGTSEMRYLSAFFYFIFHISTPYMYTRYIFSLAEGEKQKNNHFYLLFISIPEYFAIVVLVLNFFNKSIFFISNNRYYHGAYLWIMYAITVFYMMICLFYIIFSQRKMPKNLLPIHFLSIIIILTSVTIQYFYSSLLLENFGIAICVLMLYILIQKPEEALDPQLGIFNAKSFSRILEMNQKQNISYTLIVCHIEDARLINRMLGTGKMDFILKEIASFLESISEECVFYLGSSTFVITVYNGEDASFDLLKRIENRFEQPWISDESSILASVRLMDILLPNDIESLGDVYSYIDYLKELDNRQKWVVSAGNINLQDSRRNIEIEQCIRRALDENNFEMYYQPIYNVHTNKIESAEALIRLKDPELGFVSPADFIPLAERTGLILRIGEFITSAVFCFLKNNNLKAFGIKYIEMNLSVIQCMQDSFAHNFIRKVEEYRILPEMLNLEITETAAANSPKVLIKNITSLHRRGLTFSLDDFGTGYSNIRSLLDLPLNIIKFDKSMIDTATIDEKGRQVMSSSIVMIKNLGKHIVAEGIETKEQTDLFTSMGYDYFQGYYFSRPLPAQEFLSFVRKFNFLDVYKKNEA